MKGIKYACCLWDPGWDIWSTRCILIILGTRWNDVSCTMPRQRFIWTPFWDIISIAHNRPSDVHHFLGFSVLAELCDRHQDTLEDVFIPSKNTVHVSRCSLTLRHPPPQADIMNTCLFWAQAVMDRQEAPQENEVFSSMWPVFGDSRHSEP